MKRGQAGAAFGHHGPLAHIHRNPGLFLDHLDAELDGGVHIPYRAGNHHTGCQCILIRHVAEGQHALFLGGFKHTEAFGKNQIRARFDLCDSSFFGFGWIKPAADVRNFDFDLGIDAQGAGLKGIDQSIDFPDGYGGNHSEGIAFGQPAGNDTTQVGWLMNPIIKNGKIRSHRAELGSESKGDVRVIFGNPSGRLLAG